MKNKPIHDEEYVKYIEQLPCLVCGHTPKGVRKIYFESTDEFKEYLCKNNAHHCDIDRMRHNNDHRIVPLCSHYSISGNNTKNCHQIEHSNVLKSKERDEWLVKMADQFYSVYLERQGK